MAAEFSDQYVKQIVDAVQDEYFYVILHDCGSVTKMTDGMYGTGAKGLHFGNAVDMATICSQVPQDVLVFGNLAPADLFSKGPEEIKDMTADPKGKPPVVLCVLCGMSNAAYRRADGVFVVPPTALKP